MSPIKIEISNRSYTAKNKEIGGIKFVFSNLGIAYEGTENGGVVVVGHRTNLDQNNSYINKESITINKDDEAITKEIEYRTIGGKKCKVVVKISAD